MLLAAQEGHLEIVKALLAKGADVNAKSSVKGQPPLEHAAFGGHTDVVRLLLEEGVNVNAKNNAGTTALMLAAAGRPS